MVEEHEPPRVDLISMIETAANRAGVHMDRLTPDEPGPERGLVEPHVDLCVRSSSTDRLQEFLRALEDADGIVVTRVSVTRPHGQDHLVLEATLKTWQEKTA